MKLSTVKKLFWGCFALALFMLLLGMAHNKVIFGIIGSIVVVFGIGIHAVFYRCPHCGKHLDRNYGEFCQYCGKELE